MDNDLEKTEEELKKRAEKKKERKISGRSVFKLQEIIKSKNPPAGGAKERDDSAKDSVAGGD